MVNKVDAKIDNKVTFKIYFNKCIFKNIVTFLDITKNVI